MKRSISHFYGCLIGGAVGDALGAPVEFKKYSEIVDTYGDEGIQDFDIPCGQRYALITDDTQMTLFTAEGLLRSATRAKRKQKERTLEGTSITIFRAYLRWLHTQGLNTAHWNKKDYDGWLVKVGRLHAYREPGVTCLTSLGKGIMGTLARPLNDSKGCGGVMRVAPIGLVENEERAFEIGVRSAAITHGDPSVYYSAGMLALIYHYIIKGLSLEEAIQKGIDHLKKMPSCEALVTYFEEAICLAKEGEPSRLKLEALGKGFVAYEVVGIALYAALAYPKDFKKGVCLAVNHSGDSDSVGSITGGLLGAYLGEEAIPEEWLHQVELSREIKHLAEDLLVFYEDSEEWLKKYPAW